MEKTSAWFSRKLAMILCVGVWNTLPCFATESHPNLPGMLVFQRSTVSSDGKSALEDAQLYLYDFATNKLTNISQGWPLRNPINAHFSPDGLSITFTAISTAAEERDIYLWKIGDAQPLDLTKSNNLRDEDPNFSQDGHNIVFKQSKQIAIFDIDTKVVTPLTIGDGTTERSGPCYAPDREHILFWEGVGIDSNVYSCNLDGSGRTDLAAIPGLEEYYPVAWTKNRFLYTGWPDTTSKEDQIIGFNLGTGQKDYFLFNEKNSNASDPCPVNDHLVIFSSTRNGKYHLYIGDTTTGDAWPLSGYNSAIDGSGDGNGQQELGATYFQKAENLPTLTSLTAPNGQTSTATGTPPVASPQLSGTSNTDEFVTFTTRVTDTDGQADLANVYFILGSGSSELRLTYNAVANRLNASGPGGASGSFSPGTSNVLSASTGALDCKTTKITRSGNELTVAWGLKITSSAAETQNLRLQVQDKTGQRSPNLSFGTWKFAPKPIAPVLVSLKGPDNTVATASGTPQSVSPLLKGQSAANSFVTFTTVVRDGNGNADLGNVSFILGSGSNELRLTYNAAKNLLNASGPGGASKSFAPGSSNVLTVATGALDCANTTIVRSGTDITVSWRLKVAATSTVKQGLRLRVQDEGGALSALLGFGTWTFAPVAKLASPSQPRS